MKEVSLSNGGVALVDDADFPSLTPYTWRSVPQRSGSCSHTFYAVRTQNRQSVWMHHAITGIDGIIDHKNGNGLDNRRANLRLASQSQNMMNQRRHRDSSSPFKGIWKANDCARWGAQIYVKPRRLFLGLYRSPEEAARAYDDAARLHFGPFARLNFPEAA